MKLTRTAVDKRVADFVAACRRLGVKATPQRLEILRELAATGEHPDADTIHTRVRRRIPAISLDTVYRTLHLLENKGVIARVPSMKDRARFDANMDRHHHFVCERCGKIADFTNAAFDRFVPPPEVRTLGRVDTVYIELRGWCRKCQAKQKNKKTGAHP